MGLKEKQAIAKIQDEEIPKYQEYIKREGLDIILRVDWATLPPTGLTAIERAQGLLSDFSTRFWDFGQNKIANEEITKRVKGLVIRHDGTMTEKYDYKLELPADEFIFTANLEIFTVTNYSSEQKSFKDSMSDLL